MCRRPNCKELRKLAGLRILFLILDLKNVVVHSINDDAGTNGMFAFYDDIQENTRGL